jgi:outer membrane protein TolC
MKTPLALIQEDSHLKRGQLDLFHLSAVTQLEVIQAGLEVSRAQADLQVAQQREKISLSQLNALLNVPASTSWELEGRLEDVYPVVSLSGLIARANLRPPTSTAS